MTYEERKHLVCQQCGKKQQCGYANRGLQDKCPAIQEKMESWELGYQDAVDKVCELIFEYNKRQAKKFGAKSMMRLSDYTINVGDFRKAMEEQQ